MCVYICIHIHTYIKFRGLPAVVQRNDTEGKVLFVTATRNKNICGGHRDDFLEKQAAGGLGALPRPSGLVLGMEDVKFSLSLFLSL